MKIKPIIWAAAAVGLVQAGCSAVGAGAGLLAGGLVNGAMQDAAMAPYDRAMSAGRMSPTEYSRMNSDVSRAIDRMLYENSRSGPRR